MVSSRSHSSLIYTYLGFTNSSFPPAFVGSDVFRGFRSECLGVVAPEGYHEPSLQKKDSDASSHLRQMMNGEWRLKFQGGENNELLGRDFRDLQDPIASRLDALTACYEFEGNCAE